MARLGHGKRRARPGSRPGPRTDRALLGHPARAAMLAALADGQALPAAELARHARIAPATATAHLRQLVDGGMVRVRCQGRHRYHELAGPDVAAALEAIARIAPSAAVRSLRQDQAQQRLVEARTCCDHLAGRLGVELRDRLLADGALRPSGERDHVLTDRGRDRLLALGLDPEALVRSRRLLARTCIDWTSPTTPPGRSAPRRDHRPTHRPRMALSHHRPRPTARPRLPPASRHLASAVDRHPSLTRTNAVRVDDRHAILLLSSGEGVAWRRTVASMSRRMRPLAGRIIAQYSENRRRARLSVE